MKATIHIYRVSDGEVAVVEDDYGDTHACGPWQPHDVEFLWADGNYGCDCNRHLFFEDSHGRDVRDEASVCGRGRYRVRVLVNGELVVNEWGDVT